MKNKIVTILILIYIALMISVIQWGIPNQNHPFNYQMDEWHQMQSIRALFTQGSPNVPGAAHGTIFQFFLSGVYLSLFTMFGVINPFVLKSPVTEIATQEKLFILLRFNTLLFGILSLLFLGIVARKHFKVHPALPLTLFFITPIWLSLGNYYKYDIAVIFWIIISLFFLLRFGAYPNKKNYLLAGVFCGLAVATKISALPLLIIYIIAFFYFTQKKQKNYSHFFVGIFLFFCVFLILGIPDVLLQKGDYREFFYSNIILDPKQTDNFVLDYKPWWLYILLKIMPLDFGYPFFVIYATALFYWIKLLLLRRFKENYILYKNEIFILISFLIFLSSLFPLKIGANGNRLLVLLPFLSLISSFFLTMIWKRLAPYSKKAFIVFLAATIVFQAYQSFMHIYVKWDKDVRQVSSVWLDKNLSTGEKIGIENIPLYQLLPDIVVKEFYSKQYFPKTHTKFDYVVINQSSHSLPNIVIVTDREFNVDYQINSPKKLLVSRLRKKNYKIMAEFRPPKVLYNIFGNELNMHISGIVTIPTITVYKKT